VSEQHEELVHYRVDDQVASLVLDSQHNRNALSKQLVRELYDGLATAEGDDDVKVVLIRAEGRTFCSGADLSEASEQGMEQAAGVLVELQRRIATLPKPVVTRVHGNVRAGGIGIVAASDVAISAHDAAYAFTEVRLGLTPAAISLSVLPRMTDRSASLTFLTGEVFTGRDAERMGLVTRAVADMVRLILAISLFATGWRINWPCRSLPMPYPLPVSRTPPLKSEGNRC